MSEWNYKENHLVAGAKDVCLYGSAFGFLFVLGWCGLQLTEAALKNTMYFLTH